MKFRIKQVQRIPGWNYFPQVKVHWYSRWKNIGYRNGLTDDDLEAFKSEVAAESQCIKYQEYTNAPTTYTYLNLL